MLRNKGVLQHLQRDNWDTQLNAATKAYFSREMAGLQLLRDKAPAANLKMGRRKTLEIAGLVTLAMLIVLAQLGRLFSLAPPTVDEVSITIEVADIPVTEQFRRPPPPPRPSVPIPTESEEIPDDLTIASTNIDLSDIPPPPPPPDDDDIPIFVAYDEPPKIIGGMAALTKHLKYPRVAQAAGLEGVVFVKVLVGVDGKTQRTEIIKSSPAGVGFEESALKALQKVKWVPARQRDHKIRVWVSIPVQFRLVNS